MWDGLKVVGLVYCGLPCLDHVPDQKMEHVAGGTRTRDESFMGEMSLGAYVPCVFLRTRAGLRERKMLSRSHSADGGGRWQVGSFERPWCLQAPGRKES